MRACVVVIDDSCLRSGRPRGGWCSRRRSHGMTVAVAVRIAVRVAVAMAIAQCCLLALGLGATLLACQGANIVPP